jgi:hypothetical protein
MLTLYHGRTCVCSLKARLAPAEKALNFDSHLLTLRGDEPDPWPKVRDILRAA